MFQGIFHQRLEDHTGHFLYTAVLVKIKCEGKAVFKPAFLNINVVFEIFDLFGKGNGFCQAIQVIAQVFGGDVNQGPCLFRILHHC